MQVAKKKNTKDHCPSKLYELRRMFIHTPVELGSWSCCTSLPCSYKIQPKSKMCINQHSMKKCFSRKLTGGAPTTVAVTQCTTYPHTCNTNDCHILTSDSLLEIKWILSSQCSLVAVACYIFWLPWNNTKVWF